MLASSAGTEKMLPRLGTTTEMSGGAPMADGDIFDLKYGIQISIYKKISVKRGAFNHPVRAPVLQWD